MAWPQWGAAAQLSTILQAVNAAPPVAGGPAMPQLPQMGAAQVVPTGYTPEQYQQMQQQNWQQWAQWQQQYQQWHQQYGEQYQKLAATGVIPPVNPMMAAAGGAPTMPVGAPPLPGGAPPPIPTSAPPLPNDANPPPPPPPDDRGQQRGGNNWGQQRSGAGGPQPPQHQQQPQLQQQQQQWNLNNKRPFNQGPDRDNSKRQMTSQGQWSNQNQGRGPPSNPNLPPTQDKSLGAPVNHAKKLEELSEAERKFDKEFAAWESQFNTWKEQNASHPDKTQYREYEKKWESWRNSLLDRREQMRKKRVALQAAMDAAIKAASAPPLHTNAPLPSQPHHTNAPPPSQPLHTSGPPPMLGMNKPPPLLATPPMAAAPPSIEKPLDILTKPPPTQNNEPLNFKPPNKFPGEELVEADDGDGFLKSSGGYDGIPGLDVGKEGAEVRNHNDDEEAPVEQLPPPINHENKQGADLDAISKGINTILGDPKLLNMLSMVSQNQNFANSALTNTMTATRPPLAPGPPLPSGGHQYEHSNQSYDDFDDRAPREDVHNFDDQTRMSFTNGPNDADFSRPPPGGAFGKRPPNDNFSGRFDRPEIDTLGGRGRINQFNRFSRDEGPNDYFGHRPGQFARDDLPPGRPGQFGRDDGPIGRPGQFGRDDVLPGRPGQFGRDDGPLGRPGQFGRDSGPLGRPGQFGRDEGPQGRPGQFGRNDVPPGRAGSFGRDDGPPGRPGQFGRDDGPPGRPGQFGRDDGPPGRPGQFGREDGPPGRLGQFNRGDGPPGRSGQFGRDEGPLGRSDQFGRDDGPLGRPGPFGRDDRPPGRPGQFDRDNGPPNDRFGNKFDPRGDDRNSGGKGFGSQDRFNNERGRFNNKNDDYDYDSRGFNENDRYGGDYRDEDWNEDDDYDRFHNKFNDDEEMHPNQDLRRQQPLYNQRGGPPPFHSKGGQRPFSPQGEPPFPSEGPQPPFPSQGGQSSLPPQGGPAKPPSAIPSLFDLPMIEKPLPEPEPEPEQLIIEPPEHLVEEEVAEPPLPPPEEELFVPEVVVDYEHKPLKPPEPEISLEPIYSYDYRNKALNRIPYPQRPKWLVEAVKNIRLFDPLGTTRYGYDPPKPADRPPYDQRVPPYERPPIERDLGRSAPYDIDKGRPPYERMDMDVGRYPPEDKGYPSNDRGRYPPDRDNFQRKGEPDRFERRRSLDRDRDRGRSRERFNNRDGDRSGDRYDRLRDRDRDRFDDRRRDRDLDKKDAGRGRSRFDRDRRRSPERNQRSGPNRRSPERRPPRRDAAPNRADFEELSDGDFDDDQQNKQPSQTGGLRFSPPSNLELERISPDMTFGSNPSQPAKVVEPATIEDLLYPPGRLDRPQRIVIILRGPPGSGKTYLAKLIKDKEVENGGSAPRILSLDDYFMVEHENEVMEDGQLVKVKQMDYEYEAEMEESYRQSLTKAFKKTVTDGYFPFIIVDNINDKVKHFGEMWSYAKQNGFQVYICQMDLDPDQCVRRNVHNRSRNDIEDIISAWEPTPAHHPMIEATHFLQNTIPITEVEMEVVEQPNTDDTKQEDAMEPDLMASANPSNPQEPSRNTSSWTTNGRNPPNPLNQGRREFGGPTWRNRNNRRR